MESPISAYPDAYSDRPDSVRLIQGVRIADHASNRMLPVGDDSFESVMRRSVFIDKSLLIEDVLASGAQATLFCRPRRFGKSLAMTMLRSFFELPQAAGPAQETLFEGLAIWESQGGRWREDAGAYPVIYLNLNDVARATWAETYDALVERIAAECARHDCLRDSSALTQGEREAFERLASRKGDAADYAASLRTIMIALWKHYGRQVVILIDEYDAPVVAGYSNGYYDKVVDFVRAWLTGALKSGTGALRLACLTGVQRLAKESIFSGLNNLVVNTPLSIASDERFGFTEQEVSALASYLGRGDCLDELRSWYDGYRFGKVSVYNPWSVLNYFASGCVTDAYWGTTSSNIVLGDLVARADAPTTESLYELMEQDGLVEAPLDMGVVYSDLDSQPDSVWSLLYLSGYLTTDDTGAAGDAGRIRRLRIPNKEVRSLFRSQIIKRSRLMAGGAAISGQLGKALSSGDANAVEEYLSHVLLGGASHFDLVSENSYHMLLMGLLYGQVGYDDPVSNRESGRGRFDIVLAPDRSSGATALPTLIIEVKMLNGGDARTCSETRRSALRILAHEALTQITERQYDYGVEGRCLRWGIAFCGKDVAAECM